MDFSAFSHGQIQSKLWLCETLEPLLPKNPKIIILASWYNTLGMMLVIRNPKKYKRILGIDKDIKSSTVANHICDAWMINADQIIKNENKLVEEYNSKDFANFDVIINTSVEDISTKEWFNKIPKSKMIVLQTCNLLPDVAQQYNNWNILDPNPSFEIFKNKYPMKKILFEGEKQFDYGDLKYSRYMLIGKK